MSIYLQFSSFNFPLRPLHLKPGPFRLQKMKYSRHRILRSGALIILGLIVSDTHASWTNTKPSLLLKWVFIHSSCPQQLFDVKLSGARLLKHFGQDLIQIFIFYIFCCFSISSHLGNRRLDAQVIKNKLITDKRLMREWRLMIDCCFEWAWGIKQ